MAEESVLGLLDGRVAVVTRGASGIGRLVSEFAVAEGARVIVADLDSDDIGAMIGALGHNCADGIVCDFRDEAQVADIVSLAVRRFGRLDAAFNTTVVAASSASILSLAPSDWEQTVGAALADTALCIKQEAARLIAQAQGGSITNLFYGAFAPAEGSAPRAVAAAGMAALTKVAAVEFRPNNIRVNAVGCAGVEPGNSGGEAIAAARLAVYLASDEALGISGELLAASDTAAMQSHPDLARYLAQLPRTIR